jgi:hypothetical protein
LPVKKSKSADIELSAVNTRVRFEQWASNPECQANTVSAVLNVPMGAVATSLGFENKKGASPFAIARGLGFEGNLFSDDAAKLREALVRAEVLPEGTSGFEDFRLPKNRGTRVRTLAEAITSSRDFLLSLSNPVAEFPSITTGITVRLSTGRMLPEATLILDVMTVQRGSDGRVELRVGEIKIFPDRGGHTDSTHLASARAQAGVYKQALQEWIERENLSSSVVVSDKGFLVFTWPGSNWPVVRGNEDLREQADRARRGFSQLDAVAEKVVDDGRTEFDPSQHIDWVAHSETNYRETCWAFCDLAPRCQDLALEQGRGIVLGTETARTLGTVTISRALELLDGSHHDTEFEESLKTQLRSADWGDN